MYKLTLVSLQGICTAVPHITCLITPVLQYFLKFMSHLWCINDSKLLICQYA